MDEDATPKRNPLTLVGVTLLVVLAVGAVAYRIVASNSTPPSSVTLPAPAPVVKVAAPAPMVAPVALETNAVTSRVETNESAAAATNEVAPAAEIPAEIAPDPAALEAQERPMVEAQLNKAAPLYEIGEELELRLTNGLVQRGILAERTDVQLVVRISSNQTRTMEFTLLDRGTRVRSDLQFREKYIEHHTKLRVQKIITSTNAVNPTGRP